MKRLLLLAVLVSGTGCLDFDGPINACLDGGRCAPGGGGPDGGADAGTDAGADGGAPAAARCVSRNGWCWENPTPHALGINLLSCRPLPDGGREVWAGGEGAQLARWDGARWTSIADELAPLIPSGNPIGEPPRLTALWASPTSTFVVGNRTPVLRFFDGAWSAEGPKASYVAIHGQSDSEVYLVDEKSLFRRSSGWIPVTELGVELTAVHSPAPGECHVARLAGPLVTLLTLDGGSTALSIPGGGGVYSAWSDPGSNQRFLAGARGSLWRQAPDGGWPKQDAGPFLALYAGVSLADSGSQLVVGQDNTALLWRPSGEVVDESNQLSPLATVVSGGTNALRAVCSFPSGEAWAGGEGGRLYLRSPSGSWSGRQTGFGDTLLDLWVSPARVVAVGAAGTLATRQSSGSWTRKIFSGQNQVRGIWFDEGAGMGIAVETGLVHELDLRDGGSRAVPMPGAGGAQLMSVWGAGPGEVWVVGANGHFYRRHSDGGWEDAFSVTPGLNAVHGVADGGRWAVAEDGTIYRGSGTGWTPTPAPATGALYDVFALDEEHAWAVGGGGQVLVLDGGTWILDATTPDLRMPNDSHPDFYSVFATSPSDVWAAGQNGFVIHFDGSSWSHEPVGIGGSSSIPLQLEAVRATATDLWLVGDRGTILHKRR